MQSRANGHTNGHDAGDPLHGSGGAHEDLSPESVSKSAEHALDGAAFTTVGDWLAARRRVLGLSLEDVAVATRVREDYLAAFEDMDARRLPAGPYAPGFVRTYAIHLELDPEAVANRFREEMPARRARAPRLDEEPTSFRFTIAPRAWAAIAVLVVLGVLVGLGLRPGGGFELNAVPAVPEGLADWVDADVAGRATSSAPEIVGGPELALRARVPVWLEVHTRDGEVLIARHLEAEEIWTVPRVRGVLVSTDNGAGLEVLRDGRAGERLGAAGLPVTAWRADEARGLALAPEPEPVPEPAAPEEPASPPPAAAAAAAEPADVAEEEPLEDLAAEDALVTPDLPAQPEIIESPLPSLLVGDVGAVPDPDEAAAAEGRAAGPAAESGADAPDVE